MPDVFKILKDLEAKAVGIDPNGDKMQEGFFAAFRSVGLPIHKDDYDNPWDPFGGNLSKALEKAAAQTAPADPATAPKTASAGLDPKQIAVASVGRSMKTYLNTFLLIDDKLQMNNDYAVMPSSSKVSDSWWAVITGANGVPTESTLSPELQAAYDAAQAVLADKDGNPTPKYQAYMDREDEYKDKVKAYNRAYAAAMTDPIRLENFPRDGVLYQQDVDEALDRWNGLGHKPEIDKAIATLAAQGTDPAIALISRAKRRFQNSLINFANIGDIPYTLLQPETWYDADNDDGWTIYTNSEAHSESHFHSSSTSYGGSVGLNVGLWSVSGGFDASSQQQSLDIKTDDLEINFSYCAVDIKRPWLDSSLLNLRNWFLMGDYSKGCISDGSMKQELPADRGKEPVFLPSIVTSLVLVKDLSIRWSNWQADWASQESHVSGGGSVGYGPFAVSGHYSHGDQSRDFVADSSGESLMVHGVQLLGYVSMIAPESPGLNSSDFLKKPDH
jgi:hypothetical protein